MLSRASAVLLIGLVAPCCGDSTSVTASPVSDVKGTPFLVPKAKDVAKAVPPPTAMIGDTDTAKPGDTPPAAAIAVAPKTPAAPVVPEKPAGPESVTFDDLAGFDVPAFSDAGTPKLEIPATIAALSGRKVVIDGYMMPLQYEAGGAKKFLLMRYKFGCCYAVAPKINEWIEVTMEGSAVADYLPDTISSVWGVLDVKQEERDGMLSGLYKMKATRSELTEAK